MIINPDINSIKLSDRVDSIDDASKGIAATPFAVNSVNTVALAAQSAASTALSRAQDVYNEANTANIAATAANNLAVAVNEAIYSQSLALGNGATSKNNSTAVGYSANANGTSSIALGYSANALIRYSIALGYSANATGDISIAIGFRANAAGKDSIALGADANATGDYSIALGTDANALKKFAIALGTDANATGNYSIALGSEANATCEDSIAIGENANATCEDSIAVGRSASANGEYSIGIGTYSSTSTDRCMQLGNSSYCTSIVAAAAITQPSDIRDKTDITNIDDGAIEFLNHIKAIRYRENHRDAYIDENISKEDNKNRKYGISGYDKEAHARGDKKHGRIKVGVSAQEVQQALKEVYGDTSYANLVNDTFFNFDPDEIPEGVESVLTMNYMGFIPFLIKAVQELSAEIEELKKSKDK